MSKTNFERITANVEALADELLDCEKFDYSEKYCLNLSECTMTFRVSAEKCRACLIRYLNSLAKEDAHDE